MVKELNKIQEEYDELNKKFNKATTWIENADPSTITEELQSKYDELLNLVSDKFSELQKAKDNTKKIPKKYYNHLNYIESFSKISNMIKDKSIAELSQIATQMKGKELELMSYYLIGRKCGMCEYMESCDESLSIKTQKYNHDSCKLETTYTPNPDWKCVTINTQLKL